MRPEIMHADWYPPAVGRFRFSQIAQRKTWSRVADSQTSVSGMHVVHVVPHGSTTITHLQPLDPGTVSARAGAQRTEVPDDDGGELGPGWLGPEPMFSGRVARSTRGF